MTSHPDLAALLDAAIADPPTAPDPGRVTAAVAAGRRARARRRAGLGATCAVVVLAGGVLAFGAARGPGDRAGTDPGVATDPAPRGTAEGALVDGELAALTPGGRLVVRDGVEVLQRVANPLGSVPPASSLGLAVRAEDDVTGTCSTPTGPAAPAAATRWPAAPSPRSAPGSRIGRRWSPGGPRWRWSGWAPTIASPRGTV